MFQKIKNLIFVFIIFAFFFSIVSSVSAATFTWNALGTGVATDGDGVWNLTGTNWNSGASNNFPWNNANNDTATIGIGGTTPGTINLTTAITAGSLIFNAPAGYLVTGNVLTLTGTATINAAVAATIASNIDGTAGLTKTGAGVLTLTGNNIYTGTTTISAGTVQIGNSGATGRFGTGNIVNNATITVMRNSAVTLTNVITGTGTINIGNSQALTLNANNNFTGSVGTPAGSTINFPVGTVQTVGNLLNTGSNASHTVNIDGTLVFAGNGIIQMSNKNQGNNGSAVVTMNISATGDINVYNIIMASNSGCCVSTSSSSTVNINGGIVRATFFQPGGGWTGGSNSFSSTVNFNGGTITTRNATSDLSMGAFSTSNINLTAGKTNIFDIPTGRIGTIGFKLQSTGGLLKMEVVHYFLRTGQIPILEIVR